MSDTDFYENIVTTAQKRFEKNAVDYAKLNDEISTVLEEKQKQLEEKLRNNINASGTHSICNKQLTDHLHNLLRSDLDLLRLHL